jgi:2,4-dienoyl-CoA reductase-like NADH-dependent reductase (Old Yellow Enzyme family)/thioredoxin reductase
VTNLTKLFDPIKIGSLELPNRIIMPAITTCYDLEEGDRWTNFYAERARGGVGLIIVGALQAIFPSRRLVSIFTNINNNDDIPRLKRVTEAIHDNGGRTAAQLAVYDYWAKGGMESTPEDVGPSAVEIPRDGIHPRYALAEFLPKVRELTVEEIHMIEDQVGDAAIRAQEAHFDAIELQAIGGNLLNRFANPFTNQRTDEYGGSVDNRVRIITNIIANIKKKVGDDFPLICRIPGLDMVPWGLTLDDWREIAPLIEKAGANALDIMPGWHECRAPRVQMIVPRDAFVYLAEGIKQVVSIPVAAGNNINDPLLAEQLLAEGKADLIAMGRPLLADPELPNKAKEGRLDDICPCTRCCHCYDCLFKPALVSCSVNAKAGREGESEITPTEKPQNVFVIGGGPAGMEAARVAALRGHKVTLFEKNDKLGGQLLYAVLPPYKDEWNTTIKYLTNQLNKLNVEVKLNEECTLKKVRESKPDTVIAATGATHLIPDIQGVDGKNVATATEVLTGAKKVGQNVVIVGGGSVGCETAEFLHQRGKKVTILEMLPRIGADIGEWNRWLVIDRLLDAGIQLETMANVVEITPEGVHIGMMGKKCGFFEANTVVIAVGMRPVNNLARELDGIVPKLYQIGDSVKPRTVKEAIEEGFLTALML